MDISQKLNALLEERDVTRTGLGNALGVHTSTVTNWANGKNVSSNNLLAVCNYFGVPVEYFTGENEKAPAPSEDSAEAKVDPYEIRDTLVRLGFIQEGKDLTDSDLRFLTTVGESIRTWFADKK